MGGGEKKPIIRLNELLGTLTGEKPERKKNIKKEESPKRTGFQEEKGRSERNLKDLLHGNPELNV